MMGDTTWNGVRIKSEVIAEDGVEGISLCGGK